MATILAHIRVKTGSEQAFERTVRELFERSHGTEPTLRRYEYWRAQEPGQYYCLLAFDDYCAFLNHQSSPHHESTTPELMGQIASLRLEWLDPVQGASPLPPTASQALPHDAAELVRRYAGMFPVDMAAWWKALRG